MSKTVRFTISRDGTVETEFSGFAGEDCLHEAEALKEVLKKYGLKISSQKTTMKSGQQIEQELGEPVKTHRARAKVGHED